MSPRPWYAGLGPGDEQAPDEGWLWSDEDNPEAHRLDVEDQRLAREEQRAEDRCPRGWRDEDWRAWGGR